MKIRQVGAELFQRTNGQTDIHYEVNILFFQFCERAYEQQ